MQMTMTERDKKLIVMLSIVVIVVAIGWWGIRPALRDANAAKEEIEEEEELKETNDMKVARIPFYEAQIESNNEKLKELKTGFFPMMNSDQIDKKFTGLVLERGLFAFDLDIRVDRSPLSMSPYRYSRLAANPYLLNEDEEDSEDASLTEADYEEDLSGINDRVYKAHISFRIGGNKDELMRLIDDLAAYEPMLLITGYRWTESSYVEPYEPGSPEDGEEGAVLTEGAELLPAANPEAGAAEDDTELPEGAHVEEDAGGKYLVVVRQVLELDLDIYMYDDSESAEN